LRSYAQGFEALNVPETARVWPSVDRRALSRAFTTLTSQDVTFESCSVSLAALSATAQCRGTVQFVRKVGNPAP
jgi:hypothetical protein